MNLHGPYSQSVLFVCRKRVDGYGVSYGLYNSAMFIAAYLQRQGIDARVVMVTDGNDLDRVVTQGNPSHVVIEALWVTAAKFNELLALPRHKGRVWVTRIHSKLTFLANEGAAFWYLSGYVPLCSAWSNFFVSANTKELAGDLSRLLGLKSLYLPNIYSVPFLFRTPNPPTGYVDVGCFGAMRPMKNQLVQAVASIKFANSINKKLRFHMNTRAEMNGEAAYKNIMNLFGSSPVKAAGHSVILHPWTNHDAFISLVRAMDLGVQVSLNETFNIVIADCVVNDVPVVVSGIDWIPSIFHADPSSTASIANTMAKVYQWSEWISAQRTNYRALLAYNEGAEQAWKTNLNL